ncbi:MAG: hypothetical protein INR71_07975, partial [Terriglobus roseus]|nr:hypothetical protein [Terriglobus roseus]
MRPAHTNKGEIVKRLLYSSPDVGFALCAGDDKTDEGEGSQKVSFNAGFFALTSRRDSKTCFARSGCSARAVRTTSRRRLLHRRASRSCRPWRA